MTDDSERTHVDSFFEKIAGRWPAGRQDYHWHVLPPAGLVREHLADPYLGITTRPGLARVDPEWAHITVWHDAPVSDVSQQAMDPVLARVRDRCRQVSPFTARVRRPEVWATAVVCPVYPGPALRQLWAIVREAAAGTGQPGQESLNYFPHLTLAYATGRSDDGPLREQLTSTDHAEPVISVDALTLVAQQHDGRTITWSVAEVIPLGGGPSAAAPSAPARRRDDHAR